jgi:peptidoglycan/LPS O-acetylase OafA/YrhL
VDASAISRRVGSPQASEYAYPQGRLESLDLLRGIAATAVLAYHSENFLGAQIVPRSYLAVDLFFVLSGFVLAHNYDRRIAHGMTTTEFMVGRLIRLYPCYALAFVVSFVLGAARLAHINGRIDAPGLALAGALNALMLPAFNRPYDAPTLFPFNGASWSISFELVANLFYCTFFRFLNPRALALLVSGSAIVLALAVVNRGTVDLGMRPGDLVYGVPRVLFSFFVGVAIRRNIPGAASTNQQALRMTVISAVLVLTLAGRAIHQGRSQVAGDLLCVMALLPILVFLASRVQVQGVLRTFSTWAGNSSYPVYLLQGSFFFIFAAIPQVFHRRSAQFTPWIGIALIVCTIIVSLIVDRYFEHPIRAALKRWQARAAANT